MQEYAEAARAVWEMGGWAAEEPVSAFLQASTQDITFGRWLPEQAAEAQGGPAQPTPAAAAGAAASTSAASEQARHGSEASQAGQTQPSGEPLYCTIRKLSCDSACVPRAYLPELAVFMYSPSPFSKLRQ